MGSRAYYLIAVLFYTLLSYFRGYSYSPDSEYYISYADLVSHGYFDRLAVFAPLFSWTLAMPRLMGLGFEVIYCLYSTVVLIAVGEVFYRVTRNGLLAALAIILVLSNPSVFRFFDYVWSELGYAALLVLIVYNLFTYVSTSAVSSLAAGIAFMALLPIQRYIGGYVVLVLGTAVLLDLAARREYRLAGRALIWLALAALPTCFVIIWNVFDSGQISGSRSPSNIGVLENLFLTIKVASSSFAVESLLYVVTLLAIAGTARYKSWKHTRPLTWAIFAVPLIQLVAQIHSSSTYSFDLIGPRFLIVVSPVVVLLGLIVLKRFEVPGRSMKLSYVLIALALIMGLTSVNVATGRTDYHVTRLFRANRTLGISQIQYFLEGLPTGSKVGIYERGNWALGSYEVLNSTIVPSSHCREYSLVGSWRHENLSFVPNCSSLGGHTYMPVSSAQYSRSMDAFVIVKTQPEIWREFLNNLGVDRLELQESKSHVWGKIKR